MTKTQPGILTESQREFIAHDREERLEEYERRERHQYRQRIQARVRTAMRDFPALLRLADEEQFPTNDLEAVFDPDDADKIDGTAYLAAAVEFLAHAQDLDDKQLFPGLDSQPALEQFTDAVQKGVERYAAKKKGAIVSVDVDVTVEGAIPPDAALKELEGGRIDGSRAMRYAALLERAGVETERVSDAMDAWKAAQSDDE